MTRAIVESRACTVLGSVSGSTSLHQPAGVARQPVRLGVDDHELGRGDRLLQEFQAMRDTPRAGRHEGPLADAMDC